jgi:hypothetical protein
MLPLIAVIASEAGAIGLAGQFSLASGIVIRTELGGQVLATGLDFSDSDSLFYVDSECPIFVDECFNPDLSSSFTYSEYAFEEITAGGVRKGTKATAAFWISDRYFVDFEFGLVTHTEPRSLEFREVAGMIGASKLSTVFRDFQIIVAEDPDLGTPNIAFLEKELELADTDFFVISPHSRLWDFDAKIYFAPFEGPDAGLLFSGTIIVNPGIDDLIVPSLLSCRVIRDFMSQGLSAYVVNGRLDLECSVHDSALALRIRIDNHSILLYTNQLMLPQVENRASVVRYPNRRTSQLCSTRIVFEDRLVEGGSIEIGRGG